MRTHSEILPDFRGARGLPDIQQRFFSSAKTLIHDYALICNGKTFEITALELYLKLWKSKSVWFDPSTDADEVSKEQFNRGTWYVRQKKGPAFWRIDVTSGDHTEEIQAGLLIAQLNDDRGSGRAFQAIVRGGFDRGKWSDEELSLISQIHGKRIDGSDGSPLVLAPKTSSSDYPLASSKRRNIPKRIEELFRSSALRVSKFRQYAENCKLD